MAYKFYTIPLHDKQAATLIVMDYPQKTYESKRLAKFTME